MESLLGFITSLCLSLSVGFGCFHSTHEPGTENGLLPRRPLHAEQDETG